MFCLHKKEIAENSVKMHRVLIMSGIIALEWKNIFLICYTVAVLFCLTVLTPRANQLLFYFLKKKWIALVFNISWRC